VGILNRRHLPPALSERIATAWALAALFVGLAGPAQAQTAAADAEYQVKAAFLYKFLSFVEWPAATFRQAEAPVVIGVLGAEALADELSRVVVSRTVAGRPVSVRRFSAGDPVANLHVLFVGRAHDSRLPSIVGAAAGQALLIVTEADDGLRSGSIINFLVVDDKVRFDVALHRAEHAGLRISARLLSVARRVVTNPS
jgi:hypothetical protein